MQMTPIFKKLIEAAKNSCHGLMMQWRDEFAFRLEMIILMMALPIIFYLTVSLFLKLILVLLLILVLVIETINTAIETIVDRISLAHDEKSGFAKDLGSAAVGLTIIMNVIAWMYAIHSLLT